LKKKGKNFEREFLRCHLEMGQDREGKAEEEEEWEAEDLAQVVIVFARNVERKSLINQALPVIQLVARNVEQKWLENKFFGNRKIFL